MLGINRMGKMNTNKRAANSVHGCLLTTTCISRTNLLGSWQCLFLLGVIIGHQHHVVHGFGFSPSAPTRRPHGIAVSYNSQQKLVQPQLRYCNIDHSLSLTTTTKKRHRYSKRNTQVLFSSTAATDDPTETETKSTIHNNQTTALRAPPTTNAPAQQNQQNQQQEYPATPSFRDCLGFALPALGIYACPPLMSLIDAAFIGRSSSSMELAALGPASSISDSAPLPLLFLSIASTNLIAKAFARHDTTTLRQASRTALTMGGVFGTVLAVLLYQCATPLSFLYCGGGSAASAASAALVEPCSTYVAIRALALPFVVLTTIAQAISIGTKDTKTPMMAVLLAGALNLVGDCILVKGFHHGIAGAAWATALSQVVAAGLLLRVLFQRGFLQRDILRKTRTNGTNGPASASQQTTTSEKPPAASTSLSSSSTMATVRQLLSFIPFVFVMTVKIFWHNSCAATAASLGGAKAAAHTALLSVAMLCFLLGDAGSSLAQAYLPAFLVNNNNSATPTSNTNNKVNKVNNNNNNQVQFDMKAAMPTIKQLLKCTLSISTAAVGLSSIIIGLLGHQITSDPAVLLEMKQTLPWIVTALAFHGSAVTLEGVLLVQQKFPILSVCYTVLAITVAAFQLATKQFHLGLAGVWACYVWFCASRVVTFSAIGGLLRPRQWWQRIQTRIGIKRKQYANIQINE